MINIVPNIFKDRRKESSLIPVLITKLIFSVSKKHNDTLFDAKSFGFFECGNNKFNTTGSKVQMVVDIYISFSKWKTDH